MTEEQYEKAQVLQIIINDLSFFLKCAKKNLEDLNNKEDVIIISYKNLGFDTSGVLKFTKVEIEEKIKKSISEYEMKLRKAQSEFENL